jgi:hypothetical protein
MREEESPPDQSNRAPSTIEETGLSFFFLVELVTKILFRDGQLRLVELADRTKLPGAVLEPVLDYMREERLCEIPFRAEGATSASYALTGAGSQRGQQFLQRSQYVGPASVTLEDYVAQVKRQTYSEITFANVRKAFSGVVINEELLDHLAVAMYSNRAVFMYGPAGSGKSFITEQLAAAFSDLILVPHAVTVGSQVIQVFDPLVHHTPPDEAATGAGEEIDLLRARDERWVRCTRPVVITGGELNLSMLDLKYDQIAGFYDAPPQMKANNGLLVIDDLGRQLVQPRDLMNRLIVPLDRGVDYLALHTGKRFSIPFDVKVIFSTNLPPSALADEAFLRRLGYKIYVGELAESEYQEICQQVCSSLGIPFSEKGVKYLVRRHAGEKRPLLACTPRDILTALHAKATVHGIQPELSEQMLDWAWNNYFVRVEDPLAKG